MEKQDLVSLTGEQWRVMDQIAEVLAAAPDLAEGFQTALGLLLAALNRPGAALYLPRFCEHITVDWTFHGVPPAWQTLLNESQSTLRLEINQSMQGNLVMPGDLARGYAAIFPLASAGRTFGALVVSGQVIPPEEYAAWQAMLAPFARMALTHSRNSGNTAGMPGYLDLMRSRNTLRAMFDNLPISIYIVDNAYNLAAINMSRANRTKEIPKQLVGRKCYEALYQRVTPCPGCRVAETMANGQNTVRMSRHWLDADRFIEWEIATFPIFDEKNLVHQTILVEQDVTEKRNLEANLVQSEKLAAVGQLAAGVAHEINNPLTAILANAQILKREIPPALPQTADILDSLDLIEMACTRALQVVRNLLGIARKEKYDYEPVNINDSLRSALSLTQHELVGRPIHMDVNLDETLPEMVASLDQLQGVWINLILNAIDAMDKETGQINIQSQFNGSEIQVTFTDNGKGIPQEHIPRLFEPFFTTKIPGRGTGLGLSVCLRTVRHYQGDIRVESQPGLWTRFTVVFPLSKPG